MEKERLHVFILILIMVLSITSTCAFVTVMDDIRALKEEIDGLRATVVILQEGVDTVTVENQALKDEVQKAKDYVRENSIVLDEESSRGTYRLEPVIMRVTAYDLSYTSCKKYPSHPEYGITASGNPVRAWSTVAAGPEIPFGTKVFIPAFADKPNKGVFTVQDRGSAIKENCIDIYMSDSKEAQKFGIRRLPVYVLDGVVAND